MINVVPITGASLVAVLGEESAFAISTHHRADVRTFTFMPRDLSALGVSKMLAEALGNDLKRLRSIGVVESPAYCFESGRFVESTKLALIALSQSTGAPITTVSLEDVQRIGAANECGDSHSLAVAVERYRRRCVDMALPFGEIIFNGEPALAQHLEATT